MTAATKGSMDTYLTNEIISETMPGPGTNNSAVKRKSSAKSDEHQVFDQIFSRGGGHKLLYNVDFWREMFLLFKEKLT